MENQAVGNISFLTIGNECQSNANMENNSSFRHSIQKQPKLELEKGDNYEEKKGKIERYKKISAALLKKDSTILSNIISLIYCSHQIFNNIQFESCSFVIIRNCIFQKIKQWVISKKYMLLTLSQSFLLLH